MQVVATGVRPCRTYPTVLTRSNVHWTELSLAFWLPLAVSMMLTLSYPVRLALGANY